MLAVNAAWEPTQVWPIYVLAFCYAAVSSLQRPSREALLPRTVEHDQILAANALGSFGMQVGLLAGPTIGGLLIAHAGVAWCFAVDVVGLTVATCLYVAMRPYPHRAETTPPSLSGIMEGVRCSSSASSIPPRPAEPWSPRRPAGGPAGRTLTGRR